ncbi:MAG: hypothetical protein HZB92_07055 [Euryarchaeota archaeon]|nr:hypothetical protein [Euryarchaeota archaeon]
MLEGWHGREGEEDEDELRYRECYLFNEHLDEELNDERCEHCRKFMTLMCERIDEFIEEEEDA